MTIDHLFLSHADKDHVEGLIRLLDHPRITVNAIHHNGIGLFNSGFDTEIGNVSSDGRLTTLHDALSDLNGLDLASGTQAVYAEYVRAVTDSGASYDRLDRSYGVFDIGDPVINMEILGQVLEPDGR